MSDERDNLRFPESGYIGVLAEIADAYSLRYESPKEFVYLDLLAGVGVLLSGRVRVDFGELNTQPRLYLLKIAQSAWMRKSSSTKFAKKILKRAYLLSLKKASKDILESVVPDDPAFSIIDGVGSAEGLAEAFGHHIQRFEIDEDGGGGGERDKFVGPPRILLSFDEFRRLEKKANADGSVLTYMINELYESNDYANRTKGKPLEIDNGHLGLVTNTTDEVYRSMLNSAEMEDVGFLNRFFLVYSEERKRVPRPKPIPADVLDPLIDRLADMLAKLPQLDEYGKTKHEIVLPVTPEADALWDEFYTNLPETKENARLDSIGSRLMGLFAFAAGKREVDVEIMQAVITILNYERAVREWLKPNQGSTPQAKLENAVLQQLKQRGDLNERELCQFTNCYRYERGALKKALTSLQAAKEVEPPYYPKGQKRPVAFYKLAPAKDAAA